MKRAASPGWVLVLLPAIASVVAGVVPTFRGGPINVTFVAVAVVWIILGLAMKAGKKSDSAGDRLR